MRPALVGLAAVTTVHLGAQLADPRGWVAAGTQVLLMPALAWVLLAATRSRGRLVRLTLLALGFSWLADLLPGGSLIMVGCLLLAQLAYVAAFLPRWRASVVGRRPILLLPYAAGLVALIVLSLDVRGSLLVPFLVYLLALVSMAVLSTGLGRLAALGGGVFLLFGALFALPYAGLSLPEHLFWVMLTYVLAHTLIVLGVIRVVDPAEAEGPLASPLSPAAYR